MKESIKIKCKGKLESIEYTHFPLNLVSFGQKYIKYSREGTAKIVFKGKEVDKISETIFKAEGRKIKVNITFEIKGKK